MNSIYKCIEYMQEERIYKLLWREMCSVMEKNLKVRNKYVIAVIIYGTIGMILRFINFPSEMVVFARGSIGSIFILLFLIITKRGLNLQAIKKNALYLILSGIFLGLNWVFLFAAYLHTTVAIASLCNYTAPTIVVILSPILYKSRFEGKKIICLLISIIGVVFISGVVTESIQNINFIGIILGLAAALSFVMIIIFNKKIFDISAYDKAVVQLAISALTVLPYVIIHNRGTVITFDVRSIMLTILVAIFHTGIAYILYFGSLNELPVNDVAILGYLEPAVSVICSIFILRERMDIWGVIGAVMIIGAAIMSEVPLNEIIKKKYCVFESEQSDI